MTLIAIEGFDLVSNCSKCGMAYGDLPTPMNLCPNCAGFSIMFQRAKELEEEAITDQLTKEERDRRNPLLNWIKSSK